ncbi:MAG TPA: calcium-translocating P-type ATPase, SERCA-type [Clostridiaceae bacterium]|nr:calcium-translocating P-type ATPase, SERCA-type [Clostridiaceae bacterium]
MSELGRILNENIHFHTLSAEEAISLMQTDKNGLNEEQVLERRSIFGLNALAEERRRTILGMFIEQFKNVMIIILIVAAIISGFIGEITDMAIIFAIVLLNAVLGVVQESKAEKALEALKKMSKPYAKIKRNGEVVHIKSEEIVPGDIVYIEAGDYVPADMRLIESASLKIEEAALTGESVPVEKTVDKLEKSDLVIGDRKNMAYLGSSVTYGRGMGVVTATGMKTEVGKIAGYLSTADTDETPLQKKMAEMSKYLSAAVLAIAAVIFVTGILQGRNYFNMFLISVSLAVAAIPEGLPAIVTIVLALGVQKMVKRNAIIRKLPAVETLGSTEIICSDKTGTLTQNKMTVKQLYFNKTLISDNEAISNSDGLEKAIQIMTLCNDSKMRRIDNQNIETIGDPTETALISFAAKTCFYKDKAEQEFPRRAEIPFDSERKLMTTVNEIKGKLICMTKGAPDILLEKCDRILTDGNIVYLNNELKEEIKAANSEMACKALRVLALAYKEIGEIPEKVTPETLEKQLIFAGLVGMIDPPREEVKDAIKTCKTAGIRPIMITGDHRDTAAAIAKELDMINDESEAITGAELDKISDEEFIGLVDKYSVYARVSPEHKVKIVKAWKANGKVVAMTGDGVNDAPALKVSDIGVGMGITGTDVAKGVSDMVLADDNFATIVEAVKEGRTIYSNIRKSIQFLLSANMGEVLTLFIATLLNWNILLPIHILWINLVTDALPAIALGVEKPEKDVMKRKPRKSQGNFFADGLGISIIYQGIIEGLITLGTYYTGLSLFSYEVAVTMAFATLGLIQLAHSFNVRSDRKSIFEIGLFSNKYQIGAVIISALLQLIVIIVPQLSKIFKVVPLNPVQWLIVAGASLLIIPIVEIVKLAWTLRSRVKAKAK